MTIRVRSAREEDVARWWEMRRELWPSADAEELRDEIESGVCRTGECCFVAEEAQTGGLVGFVEVGLRSVADGCDSSPVGYIEGWYVEAFARRQGVGKLLIQAAEEWARSQGCREIASDGEIENKGSIEAHKKLGFQEVSRVVTFCKSL